MWKPLESPNISIHHVTVLVIVVFCVTISSGYKNKVFAVPAPSAYVIDTADGSDAELAVDAIPLGEGSMFEPSNHDVASSSEHTMKEEIEALMGSMKRLCSRARREELITLVGAGGHRRQRSGAVLAANKLIERLCASEFRRRR